MKIKGVITIRFRDMNSNLKFWLYFSLFLPLITMAAFSCLLINNLSSLISVVPIYYYVIIAMSAALYIGITLLLFSSIKKHLHVSSKKIYDWSQKIKEGDLTQRLTFTPKSDLYYISQSFNTMADIIENLVSENERKIDLLSVQNKQLEQLNNDLVMSLVSAIEAKDKYTIGHSERVSKYATSLAKKLNLPEEKIEEIRIAGMLHDVGKIGVSDDILNKPDRLSKDEYEEMKRHPSIGSWILNTLNLPESTIDAINYHHERYDGKGYPLGLSGNELSLETQLISLSDAYDAMTSERPYRSAMSHEEAIKEIKKASEKQFNPALVALIEQNDLRIMQ